MSSVRSRARFLNITSDSWYHLPCVRELSPEIRRSLLFCLVVLTALAFSSAETNSAPINGQSSGAERVLKRNPFYSVVDLGTLGGTNSVAFGINNKGQIVGEADTPEYSGTWGRISRAFHYESGKMRDLGAMDRATGINDRGIIVGQSVNQVGCLVEERSVKFDNGKMEFLTLDKEHYTWVGAVNDFGHWAGLCNLRGRIRAFRFVDHLQNLGGFANTNRSEGYGINNAGDVVGRSWISNSQVQSFLWRDGRMVNLGTLPGDYASGARDINNNGVVVGWSSPRPKPTSNPRAVIYGNDKIQNLNELIPADSGWVLLEANGINDFGQIVGSGRIAGKTRAFLLSPLKK